MELINSLELNVILQQVEEYACFSLGKKRVAETVPVFDRLLIRQKQVRMNEALTAIRKFDTMPFNGIRDMRETLEKAKKGSVLSAAECMQEISLIYGIKGIVSYMGSLDKNEYPALHELTDSLTVHSKTQSYLLRCFNAYGEIMDSASDELRNVRIGLRNIDTEINAAVQRFVNSHKDSVVDSIVTTRNDRTVVLVNASEKNSFGGMVYGDSASGQTSYIEPAVLVPLNNKKQQLKEREHEEIHRILLKCTEEIASVAYEEIANIETCGILDEVFAKAQWGYKNEGCAPVLSDERKIVLKRARHPLIDIKTVVRNDYRLQEPQKLLLITGPNTGGKTVSMKVIGLSVLMTYCGIPLTADEAEIPFFDAVYADIGDDQSVMSSLSSFSAHIKKQAEVMRNATKDSLVLLDEVGSGTDPKEGEALAIAILNELRHMGAMTVCTTHYDRLKAYGKRHNDILLAGVQFDMEKLMPTYKYFEGFTGQSNAFEVAERYGLPSSIVKYARFLKDQAKGEEDELIEKLENQLNENLVLRQELEEKLTEVKKSNEEIRRTKLQLAKEKDVLRDKAKQEADQYVEEIKAKADRILKKIMKHQENVKYHEALKEVSRLNTIDSEPQEKKPEEPLNVEYKVGDAVELKSSNSVCKVLRVEKKDIVIDFNGREVHVKKNQIRPSLRVIPKEKPQVAIHVAGDSVFETVSMEVNLIGLHADEAMEKLDQYLDSLKLHQMKMCRIIHGEGSGKLRKEVHARLLKDSSVKSFRLGLPNEGGSGATIVKFK